MKKRFAYFMAGYVVGTTAALLLEALFGLRMYTLAGFIGTISGVLSVRIAERAKKVKTKEELNQPLSIFPRKSVS